MARPLARLSGTLDELLTDASLQPARGTPGCRRPSPTRVDPSRRWSACAPASRTPSRCTSPPRAASRPGTRPATAGKSAHRVALDFVDHVRGSAATEAESALLREALECCPEDRDLLPELVPADRSG